MSKLNGIIKTLSKDELEKFVNNEKEVKISPNSRLVALLLLLNLGFLGIHRFYVGKTGTGLLYLFTCGFFGIGFFVDLVKILNGTFTDWNGRPISVWLNDK